MNFDFNETNILKQNLFLQTDTKEILVARLSELLISAQEPVLRHSVNSLISKVNSLTPEQLKKIQQDIADKKIIATLNYKV